MNSITICTISLINKKQHKCADVSSVHDEIIKSLDFKDTTKWKHQKMNRNLGSLRNLVNTAEIVGNKAKRRILKRVFQDNKARHIFVKNVRFCGKFGVLCFHETPVLRYALLPYYRWNTNTILSANSTKKTYLIKSMTHQLPTLR